MELYKCLGKCCFSVSQRFVVGLILIGAVSLQFAHRTTLPLVITEITLTLKDTNYILNNSCIFIAGNNQTSIVFEHHHRRFFWSDLEQGFLISAFYIGYFMTQIFGANIVDKYGGKRVFGCGLFINAACSLIIPLSAKTGLYALAAVQIVMGISQGPLLPVQVAFVSSWHLFLERFIPSTIIFCGWVVGGILGFTSTGLILHYSERWEVVFYSFSAASFLWWVFWITFVYENFDNHPFISQKEKEKLSKELTIVADENYDLNLRTIFKSVPMWMMFMVKFGTGWFFFFSFNILPKYLSNVLLLNPKENGLLCSMPLATMFLFLIFVEHLPSLLVSRGYLARSTVIKLCFLVSNIISSLCLLAASYAGCSQAAVIMFFSLSMGFVTLEFSAMKLFTTDLSANNVASLWAVTNGVKSTGGFLGPLMFSAYFSKHLVEDWRGGFIFSAIFVSTTTVIYIIWGSAEIRKWHFAIKIPGETQHPQS